MRHGAASALLAAGVTPLLCEATGDTVTHGLRWESTDTWWAISGAMR